jgi:hypothetical protein
VNSAVAKSIFPKICHTIIKCAVFPIAILFNAPKTEAATLTPQLIQEDLFFGRNIPGDGEVSDEQFQGFVNNVITPRFPEGLTIFDASGQFLDSTGTIVRERSKDVTLFVEDTPQSEAAINDIAEAYVQQFNQEAVLRVANKDNLKVSFGFEEDLFNNSLDPKFIRADLFFGRSIPGGGEVSSLEFQEFINDFITPRFPEGLTVFDASGQFLNSADMLVRENTKVVTFLLEDTLENELSINEIVREYVQQFNQESVLQAVNEDINVSFGLESDLFNNSPEPKFIRVDLFFGRSIPGGGEVSLQAFQEFINNVITPRFPEGLTVFDASGQFLNSAGMLVREDTKTVTLLLEDSLENELSINEIVRAYVQQFNQESVLQVVDEDVEVTFITATRPISVPEPTAILSLVGIGILGSLAVVKRKLQTSAYKGLSNKKYPKIPEKLHY